MNYPANMLAADRKVKMEVSYMAVCLDTAVWLSEPIVLFVCECGCLHRRSCCKT